MTTVAPPTFTDSVNQAFFIEAQGGAQNPISYLDRFPEAVYAKSIDSLLVAFLYALLGPVGVGLLRQQYLEARLQFEDAGLDASNLDAMYTHPFAFARLADETYTIDASAQLLTVADRTQILANDASFRNRATNFLKGIRAGGTLQGVALAAKSGLNRPVDIVENYRSLYDQHSDLPLGLPYQGSTTSLGEVIVIPRQDIPRNAEQTLTIKGEPTSGWFTLIYPAGPPNFVVPITLTSGSNNATVPSAAMIPSGNSISITNQTTSSALNTASNPTIFAESGFPQLPTTVTLVYPPSAGPNGTNLGTAGQPYNMATSGTYWAYVGNAETIPLSYNATAQQIQSALQALPIIGPNNVAVSGGPLPDQPITIQFCNKLGDQPVPTLIANTVPTTPATNGIGGTSAVSPLVSELTDITHNPIPIVAMVNADVAGVSADSQTTAISPQDEHAMQLAVDQIRPITSIISTQPGQGVTLRQPANTAYAPTSYTEVVRYETGSGAVQWPRPNNIFWILPGIEVEVPCPYRHYGHHYCGFHNIAAIFAYTEAALLDAFYDNPDSLAQPLWVTYWNIKIGVYSPRQVVLYPFLREFVNRDYQFSAELAIASSPEPLVITNAINGVGIINNNYPVDLLGLPGVPELPTQQVFWASSERAPAQVGDACIDYLEIDLGTPQAVNYIYLEATTKPYSITIDYDTLDQAPARNFTPVTMVTSEVASSVSSLTYSATDTNPWQVVELHFTNSWNQLIFTRFLRIGFVKTPDGTPFALANNTVMPYSIEIRNLRVGRNLSTTVNRQCRF